MSLGDKDGVDGFVKKYALSFDYRYREANPPHTVHNLYSLMSENFYGKPYQPRNFHLRNKIFSEVIDQCVVFDETGGRSKAINNLVKQLNRSKKQVVVLD